MDYEEWRDQKQQRRDERRERWAQQGVMWSGGRRHGWMARGLLGVIFITIGALFLLSNLGVFYFDNLWEFWPVILIALGLSRAAGSRHISGWMSGGVLTLIGTVFL